MSGEKLPEDVYRELLKDTREALKVVRRLMKSKNENVKIIAIDKFIPLCDIAVALAEALGEKPEQGERKDRNPLARRSRLDR